MLDGSPVTTGATPRPNITSPTKASRIGAATGRADASGRVAEIGLGVDSTVDAGTGSVGSGAVSCRPLAGEAHEETSRPTMTANDLPFTIPACAYGGGRGRVE